MNLEELNIYLEDYKYKVEKSILGYRLKDLNGQRLYFEISMSSDGDLVLLTTGTRVKLESVPLYCKELENTRSALLLISCYINCDKENKFVKS